MILITLAFESFVLESGLMVCCRRYFVSQTIRLNDLRFEIKQIVSSAGSMILEAADQLNPSISSSSRKGFMKQRLLTLVTYVNYFIYDNFEHL